MSGKGRILQADSTTEPASGRAVVQLLTDAPVTRSAVHILPQSPAPALGDEISWDTGHVYWQGRTLRKIGYAFDPAAPLR